MCICIFIGLFISTFDVLSEHLSDCGHLSEHLFPNTFPRTPLYEHFPNTSVAARWMCATAARCLDCIMADVFVKVSVNMVVNVFIYVYIYMFM